MGTMTYMPESTDAHLNVKMTWGQALQWATGQSTVPGGLKRSLDPIYKVFDKTIGSRASFQNLFDVTTAADLSLNQARRAWALLLVSGYEPTDAMWGLPTEDVIWPASTAGSARLRELLESAVQEVQARSHPAGRDCSRMVFAAA